MLLWSHQLWVREQGLIPACLSGQEPASALGSQSATVWRGTVLSLTRPCEVLKLPVCPVPAASGAPEFQWEAVSNRCQAFLCIFPWNQGLPPSLQAWQGCVCTFALLLMELLLYPLVSASRKGSREQLQLLLCSTEPLGCPDNCNVCWISSDERRILLNSLCNFFQRDPLH